MNNTELANFKKKLSIELETTTSDEAQLISNIVDSASAGALPAVSADDNGKVLTVSSGAWVAAQPSGGGGMVVSTNPSTGALDKTWKEIHDALASGIMPIVLGVNTEYDTNIAIIDQVNVATEGYSVSIIMFDSDFFVRAKFRTDNENGYPTLVTPSMDDPAASGGQ